MPSVICHRSGPTRPQRDTYVDPYHVGDSLFLRPPPSSHYARSDITYAKPEIYRSVTYLLHIIVIENVFFVYFVQ